MDWEESVDLTSDLAELDEDYMDNNVDNFQFMDCIAPNTDPKTDPLEVSSVATNVGTSELSVNDSETQSISSRIKIHNNIIISPPVINKTNSTTVDLTEEISTTPKSPSVLRKVLEQPTKLKLREDLMFSKSTKLSPEFSPTKPPKKPPIKIFESPPNRLLKNVPKKSPKPVNISNVSNQVQCIDKATVKPVKIVLSADVLAELTNSKDSVFLNIPGMGQVQLTDETKKVIEAQCSEWIKKGNKVPLAKSPTDPLAPLLVPLNTDLPTGTNTFAKVAQVSETLNPISSNATKTDDGISHTKISNISTTTGPQTKTDVPVMPRISNVQTLSTTTFDISQLEDDNAQIIVVHDDDDIVIVENDESGPSTTHNTMGNIGEMQRKCMQTVNLTNKKAPTTPKKTNPQKNMENTKNKNITLQKNAKPVKDKDVLNSGECLIPDGTRVNVQGIHARLVTTRLPLVKDPMQINLEGLISADNLHKPVLSSESHLVQGGPRLKMNKGNSWTTLRNDSNLQTNAEKNVRILQKTSPPSCSTVQDGLQGRISVRNFQELIPSRVPSSTDAKDGSSQPKVIDEKFLNSVLSSSDRILFVDAKGNMHIRTLQNKKLPSKSPAVQVGSQVASNERLFSTTELPSTSYTFQDNSQEIICPIGKTLIHHNPKTDTDAKHIHLSRVQKRQRGSSSSDCVIETDELQEIRKKIKTKKKLQQLKETKNKISCLTDIKYCWKRPFSKRREDFCFGFTQADRTRIGRCLRKLNTQLVFEEWQYKRSFKFKQDIDELRAQEHKCMLANVRLVEIGNITKKRMPPLPTPSTPEPEPELDVETVATTEIHSFEEEINMNQEDLLLLTRKVTFNPENPRGRRRKNKLYDTSQAQLNPSKVKKLIHGYKQSIAMSRKLKEMKMMASTKIVAEVHKSRKNVDKSTSVDVVPEIKMTHISRKNQSKSVGFKPLMKISEITKPTPKVSNSQNHIVPCYVHLTRLEDLPNYSQQYGSKSSVLKMFSEKVIKTPGEFRKRLSDDKPLLILTSNHLGKLLSYTKNYKKYNLAFPVDVKKRLPRIMYHNKTLSSEVEVGHIMLVDQSVLCMYLQGDFMCKKKIVNTKSC